MKAKELSKSLTDLGFGETEVTRLVKARMDSGTVDNDEVTASEENLVDPQILDEAVDALKKSIAGMTDTAGPVTSMEEAAAVVSDSIAKSAGPPDDTHETDSRLDSEAISIIAKGADSIVRRVDDQHKVLATAVLALGKLTQNMAKAMTDHGAATQTMGDRVEILTKALNIPLSPRSVSGSAAPIPAPGETVERVITKADVVSKAKGMLSDSDIQHSRAHQLVEAVSLLDSGANPAHIAQTYSIPVS